MEQQEAYTALKNAIESELRHWRERHKALAKQCAIMAESLRKLSETQMILQEELERWPDSLARLSADCLTMRQAKSGTTVPVPPGAAPSPLPGDTSKIDAIRLRKDISRTEERIQTLQKSMQHESSPGVKLALKQQMEIAVRDLEHMRESLHDLTRDIAQSKAANDEANAAAAALQFLEELAEEQDVGAAERNLEESLPDEAPSSESTSDSSDSMVGSETTSPAQDSASAAPTPPQDNREWEKRIQAVISEHGFQKQLMGYILVKAGFISKEQLEEALGMQRSKPHSHLGEILVELAMVSPEIIALVLAAQSRAVYVRLADVDVDPDAVTLISERLAYQHTCLPIKATDESLDLVIANPMDLVAIEDVECATNRHVNVLVATEQELHDALEKYYWEPE